MASDRTITAAAELDALPVGSVVRGADGAIYMAMIRLVDKSRSWGSPGHLRTQVTEDIARYNEFTLLHVPGRDLRAEDRADALRDAADALNYDGVSLKPGTWGSTPADIQTIDFGVEILKWLRDRAAAERGGES